MDFTNRRLGVSIGRVSPEFGVLHTIRAFAAVCSQW